MDLDWMDVAIQLQREANGDPEKAAFLATEARQDNWEDPVLADAEHFLFARYWGQQSPLHGLAMMVGAPAYAAYKWAGFKPEATPASWDQVQAGMAGGLFGLLGE